MKQTQTLLETLVLGGTGKTGRRVAARLWDKGAPVRLGTRSGRPSFDWDNPNTWPEALRGMKAVYVSYYPDIAFPGAAETVASFVKLAVDSGVRRLVLLSGRGEEGAQRAEQSVKDSGAEWTIVRASWFNQNFSEGHLLESVQSGEIAFPAGNMREPFLDAEDIADVAVAALTDRKHIGQLYELTGPRLLTFTDAAAEISYAAGREIRYIPVSPEQYRATLLEYGLPPDFADSLVELFATVLDGRNASVADGVQRALGRPPRDFADYARDAAASGVWNLVEAAQ